MAQTTDSHQPRLANLELALTTLAPNQQEIAQFLAAL
jgi:hypothetical protein